MKSLPLPHPKIRCGVYSLPRKEEGRSTDELAGGKHRLREGRRWFQCHYQEVCNFPQPPGLPYPGTGSASFLPSRMTVKEGRGSGIISGGKTLYPILQTFQHVSSATFLMYVGHIQDQFLNFSKIRFGKLLTQFCNGSKGGKEMQVNPG